MGLRRLIFRQEKRAYHPFILPIFAVFTGLTRGVMETLLSGLPLRNSDIFLFVPFYVFLGYAFTLAMSHIIQENWKRVSNLVIITLFLGIFPPILEALGGETRVRFSYYLLSNFAEIPWLYYSPRHNIPFGETVVVWLSITLCASYAWIKTSSLLKAVLSFLAAYLILLFTVALFPMALAWLSWGPVEYGQSGNPDYESLSANLSFWQIVLAFCLYFAIRPKLFTHLLRRSLHILPCVWFALLGANATWSPEVLLSLISVYISGLIALAQNDYFDRNEDKQKSPVTRFDVQTLNLLLVMLLLILFVAGYSFAIVLSIFFLVSVLYNYPFYRGKKRFPSNMKIEGIWGGASFLAGALSLPSGELPEHTALTAFLFFGGWSIISSLKDIKDIRSDARARSSNLYFYLLRKGFSLKRAHGIIITATLLCLLVPYLYFLTTPMMAEANLLLLPIVFIMVLSRQFPNGRWFSRILLGINGYLLFLCFLLLRLR